MYHVPFAPGNAGARDPRDGRGVTGGLQSLWLWCAGGANRLDHGLR